MYDSRKEAQYAALLDTLRKATAPKERVVSVERQVPYPITIKRKPICKYVLDFKVTYADGRVEHIDVKGMKTDIYRLKKKMVKACYDIDILER